MNNSRNLVKQIRERFPKINKPVEIEGEINKFSKKKKERSLDKQWIDKNENVKLKKQQGKAKRKGKEIKIKIKQNGMENY